MVRYQRPLYDKSYASGNIDHFKGNDRQSTCLATEMQANSFSEESFTVASKVKAT